MLHYTRWFVLDKNIQHCHSEIHCKIEGVEGTLEKNTEKLEIFASDGREKNHTHTVYTGWIKDPEDPHRCFHIFWLIRLLFWLKLADLLYTMCKLHEVTKAYEEISAQLHNKMKFICVSF